MKEIIVICGFMLVGVLSSLAMSWKPATPTASAPNRPQMEQQEPVQPIADAPPRDDRGTPGQRS
jgi:hypothetical protein